MFIYIKLSVKADLSFILKNDENGFLNTFNFETLRENTNKYLNFSDREFSENFQASKYFDGIWSFSENFKYHY